LAVISIQSKKKSASEEISTRESSDLALRRERWHGLLNLKEVDSFHGTPTHRALIAARTDVGNTVLAEGIVAAGLNYAI